MMKISVKTLDSQTKNFTIPGTITVKGFKQHIASEVNIPADKQRLIFKGKVLQDEKLLSEYGADGCVIHLVERRPQTAGASSQDGASNSSSTTTGPSPGGGVGPNIVMGAFSMPVDVVGATQQIVQSLVNQLGVDSAQANISTSSSDDGSSVNVHINLQATTQPGNDVSQRINRARHFIRAASNTLNRTEGELPMDTSEPSDDQRSSQTENSSAEESTAALSSPEALAQILREVGESMTSMQTAMNRYVSLLGTNSPEELSPSEDTLPDRVAEAFHNLSHAYHALSDITFNFRGSEPRRPSVLTPLSPHGAQVPMLSSLVGAPHLVPNPGTMTSSTAAGTTQSTTSASQQPQGTNQNLRIHVNPQGGISLTTIISNVSQPGSATPASTQLTSTSGTRMSTSTDNGAARETLSSLLGEQQPSAATTANSNVTSSSTSASSSSTQTGQPSVRTRIIVDDFIALISNVPASAAAAAAASQGQMPATAQSGTPSLPQMMGVGITATATGSNQSQPQTSVSSASGVPNPAHAQGQARPQGLPGGIPMNLMSNLGAAASNHPDPSLPCQSFHFGPQSTRSASQQTTQQPSVPTTATPAPPPRSTAATPTTIQSQAATQSETQTTPSVSQPQPARERPRATPERRFRARDRMISPADLQGILGMMAHDQRTGFRGLPRLPTGLFGSRGGRRSGGRQARGSDGQNVVLDLLDSIISDARRQGGGQSQTINAIIQALRASGIEVHDEEGLLPALFSRLSNVLTIEDVIGVVLGSEDPYDRMRPALLLYISEDLLHGNPQTSENLSAGVAELCTEMVNGIADSIRSVPTKDDIDIVASSQSFLEHNVRVAVDLVLSSEDNPRFAEYFQDHIKEIVMEYFTLLVFCYRDGFEGIEQVVRSRAPQARITEDMDDQTREILVQMLLRNIRQMYYSRAYCYPRLERFMIHAPSPPPPGEEQPPSKESHSPQETVDGLPKGGAGAVDEEMDSHGSDDSETFTTPPGSIAADAESDVLEPDCPEGQQGEDAIEEDEGDDEWKAIMPEDWIPVITTDIVRQRRMPSQAPFSDAYINGRPPKRRKILDQQSVPPSETSISDALKQAVSASGATPLTSVEALSKAAKENRVLHDSFRKEVKKEVKSRLEKDTDYRPDRFPNTRDYFDKDTP